MHILRKIVVYTLATIGLAFVVKHLRVKHCEEGCCLCGWHKTKVEEVKSKVEEIKSKVEGFKTKVYGEKRTGSRYGSNPVKY
ncbi:MAG: hypothetical protein ACM3KR_02695 [Deltaproteobacteria bacterium]|jgi:hypothetical protein